MKKTNNKGFSLVELIIVIAIMAILAGAIAPALIRYIDKSRKSNDISSCKTIKTAVETALGNEDVYAYLTNTTTAGAFTVITINPGKATDGSGSTSDAIAISGCKAPDDVSVDDVDALAKEEIGTNIGEKTPKIKYKKAGKATGAVKPAKFYALINEKGTVYVVIGGDTAPTKVETKDNKLEADSGAYVICPEICEDYQ